MPLDSHQIVLQSLGWILLTVDLAHFRAEPAEPLCEQWAIVHQQNVCGHFVSWKAHMSGLHPALEESRALLCVSHSVLGHNARHMSSKSSSRSKLNCLLVGGMLSLPLPDAACLEAFTMIVGTKTDSNSYA